MKALTVSKPVGKSRRVRAGYSRETPIGVLGVVDLRSCVGRDGVAYSYGLTLDGAPAAIVRDDASGGMLDVRWSDDATEKRVTDYARTLPPVDCADCDGRPLPYDVELLLAELADEADAAGAGR